ncbi:MAG: hypothetical protein P9M15_02680, partial [Candidatus Electryoneaceae bacterium]|nr:hypothetical protein [Candidatus Electryoneaceae bacterium]
KRDPDDRPQSAEAALIMIGVPDAEETVVEEEDVERNDISVQPPTDSENFSSSTLSRERKWRIRPKWAGLWIVSILIVIVLLIGNPPIFPPFDKSDGDTISIPINGDGIPPHDNQDNQIDTDEQTNNSEQSDSIGPSDILRHELDIPASQSIIPTESGSHGDTILTLNRTEGSMEIGYVTIIARPWANVAVDGRTVGVTPAVGTLELDTGEHTLLFEHESLPSVRRKITVAPGIRDTIDVNMRAGTVRVVVSISPWGYLWVDGDSIGMFPRPETEPVWLLSGLHHFEVERPGQENWSDSLTLDRRDRMEIRIDLKTGTMIAVNNEGDRAE